MIRTRPLPLACALSLVGSLPLAATASPPHTELSTALPIVDPGADQEEEKEKATSEGRIQELENQQKELERKLEALAGELERMQIGDIAPPIGEGYGGLGAAASKIYDTDGGLSIGGYGEYLYQNFTGDSKTDDSDFLRAVFYFGYKFDDHWVLNTEVEIEHADEVFLEFATIDYLHRPEVNARVGLVLMPMGFLNELHEPNTFYSARRPDVESFIIPSTWRENGIGVFGDVGDWSYRAYVVNGFDGTDFRSKDGLRGGRQKGSKADSNDFGGVARVDWMGVTGLTVGGSYYYGNSGQEADVDGEVSIYEAHAELNLGGWRLRGLYAEANVDDVLGLAEDAGLIDSMGMFGMGVTGTEVIGEELEGGYLEVGYDVLAHRDTEKSLVPFVRFETYDLQKGVPAPFVSSGARDVDVLTFGVSWSPIPNLVFKADYQDYDTDGSGAVDQLNLAAGYVF